MAASARAGPVAAAHWTKGVAHKRRTGLDHAVAGTALTARSSRDVANSQNLVRLQRKCVCVTLCADTTTLPHPMRHLRTVGARPAGLVLSASDRRAHRLCDTVGWRMARGLERHHMREKARRDISGRRAVFSGSSDTVLLDKLLCVPCGPRITLPPSPRPRHLMPARRSHATGSLYRHHGAALSAANTAACGPLPHARLHFSLGAVTVPAHLVPFLYARQKRSTRHVDNAAACKASRGVLRLLGTGSPRYLTPIRYHLPRLASLLFGRRSCAARAHLAAHAPRLSRSRPLRSGG